MYCTLVLSLNHHIKHYKIHTHYLVGQMMELFKIFRFRWTTPIILARLMRPNSKLTLLGSQPLRPRNVKLMLCGLMTHWIKHLTDSPKKHRAVDPYRNAEKEILGIAWSCRPFDAPSPNSSQNSFLIEIT